MDGNVDKWNADEYYFKIIFATVTVLTRNWAIIYL